MQYKVLFEKESSLLNYSLVQAAPGFYIVKCADSYELGMLFARVQEYYESPMDEYRGKNFCLFEFMNRYRKNKGRESFSYPLDWGGYNVPSSSFEPCLRGVGKVDYITPYDHEMLVILHMIRAEQPIGPFYLIGVEEFDGMVINHESAHALFYLNGNYRADVELQIKYGISKSLYDKLEKRLLEEGYTHSVVIDEIQAYCVSDPFVFKGIRGIKTLCNKLSKIHKQFKIYEETNKINTV